MRTLARRPPVRAPAVVPRAHGFAFTGAVVRGIPASMEAALAREAPGSPVDMALAREQKAGYEAALAAALGPGGRLTRVPAADAHPDCVFVEDTAVVVGSTAVVTVPGHPSRRGETGPVADALQGLGLRVARLAGAARMDGGDVCAVGGHVLVGLSERTNAEGARQLAEALRGEGVRVAVVPVPSRSLHLKSVLSPLDESTLVVWGEVEEEVRARLGAAGVALELVPVPDMLSSNVVRVNGDVLAQPGGEASAGALARAAGRRGLAVRAVPMGELAKVDGALTCCSLLVP